MVRTLVPVFLILIIGCSGKEGRSFIPHIPGYDESKMEQMVMPKKLKEISGMFFMADGRIAANNDEKGILFFLKFENRTDVNPADIESFEFGGKADYEDIVQVDTVYYLMESNGNIHEVFGPGISKEYKFEKIKKTEFESMYFDKAANKLILVTKDHKLADHFIFAYSFDLATKTFSEEPYYKISMREVHFRVKNSSIQCKPSAAAIHPILHKLFIVASIGKVILECTLDGKVEKAYQINPVQFPQPEGITFAPNGDMYISNEGGNGKGTILKFPYAGQQ
jgi:hypothetical protein